ncbi:MAG: hypothetical protein U1E09_00315 [Methylococcales bacterium]|nr:hypothetical protein [Methylobacter sp.]MDZ4154967.1 hypothetical protein [Methylococcales bacterium]MDP2097487.1 hypothetical protein [Methylobacter sp.]MDP2426678.1 hypothetical protein [Methylobacter sp.]MDP3055345.1 hypothetical protein [Methylobacter sp.]
MDDKALMSLPHPIRFEIAINGTVEKVIFESMGIMDAMKPYLTDQHAPTESIINTVPIIKKTAISYLELSGGNLGSFLLMMARARLRAHGDAFFQITPALQTLLDETDLGKDLPSHFFRPPYAFIYLEFAQPNPFYVLNKTSGEHLFEGAYIASYELPAHHNIFNIPERNRYLQLDPSKPIRLLELVLTGSPIGKENALDDASQDLILFIQNEDECLQELLDRHITFFKSPNAYCHRGMAAFNANEADSFKAIIYAIAKALLYLNLPESRQEKNNERTELENRIALLGNKKASKLSRKLEKTYDKIIVGPSSFQDTDEKSVIKVGAIKTHWRRGHFRRIRIGEGRTEVKIGWIQPSLVNANNLTEGASHKNYSVR